MYILRKDYYSKVGLMTQLFHSTHSTLGKARGNLKAPAGYPVCFLESNSQSFLSAHRSHWPDNVTDKTLERLSSYASGRVQPRFRSVLL